MKTTTWTLYVFVGFLALCHVGFSSPIVKRQVLDNPAYIDPAQQDLESNDETDRGKRYIEPAVELTFGAKNAILGLFFNHTFNQLLHKQFHLRHKRAIGVTASPKMPTTTEDLVVFNPGEKVSLEVPDQLFGSGFTLVTNISQVIGSVIQDSEDESEETLDARPFVLSDPSISTLNLKWSEPNSAERTAKLFEAMKPFLQTVFGVNSLHVTRDGPANNKI